VPLLAGVCAAAAVGCASTTAATSDDDESSLTFEIAPTAMIVPPGRDFYGIVDDSVPRPSLLCFNSAELRGLSITVTVDDPEAKADFALVDPLGQPVDGGTVATGSRSLQLHSPPVKGRPAACLWVKAVEGFSSFRLRWTTVQ
jgi:hypothetical protein